MNHLVPCPECNRHVRVSELECPFCALPLDLASTPAPQLPRSRLSRAATFAFGATFVSATAISACGGDAEESAMSNNTGAAGFAGAGANVGGTVPPYGSPPEPTGGQFGVAGFPNANGGLGPMYGAAGMPVYGGPPGEDAGMGGTINVPGAAGASGEAGAGASPDETGGKGGGPVAVYGGPP
jgi:hypothetical protein